MADHPEWLTWQPNRTQGSKEPQEWGDFMAWCNQWARWTERTTPIRTREEVEAQEEPPRPAWHARVYGGQH